VLLLIINVSGGGGTGFESGKIFFSHSDWPTKP